MGGGSGGVVVRVSRLSSRAGALLESGGSVVRPKGQVGKTQCLRDVASGPLKLRFGVDDGGFRPVSDIRHC